jgi:Integrase core domain/HTH-like domain
MVERVNPVLPVSQQCRLLGVSRSSVYRKPAEVSAEDLAIMALIDRQYLARPYYGSRRMAAWLATQGHRVNRKRVRPLMRLLGLAAIYQRPNTSKPAPAHKIYPYLLGGIAIERVNQVWCSDVTYIPMAKGFLYLVVIMDWVSRAVLAWRLSNTLGADFCVEALEEALSRYGRPEIFNTDQGSQFTSDDLTSTLKDHGITISMDGKSLPSRKRGAAAWTTSLSSGCGAASNTKKSTSMPMQPSPRPGPASAPGSVSTLRSVSIRASAIARRGKFTRKACGYMDDRRCRPAALPPLPEPARKAGKCSPSPTSPQAPPPTTDLILMK